MGLTAQVRASAASALIAALWQWFFPGKVKRKRSSL